MKQNILKSKILFTAIVILFGFSNASMAQSSLTLDASQSYTSFKFLDTQDTKLNSDYQGSYTGSYSIGYRYYTDFGLIIRPSIGMRNAGASLVYDDMNHSWKLQYADFKLGAGYRYEMGRFNPYFIASGYYGYLLRGIQVLNNEEFNITESGILNRSDYGVVFTPGVDVTLSDFISTYLEFNYLWGLSNIETDEGQTASNFSYGLTLGLSFSITQISE